MWNARVMKEMLFVPVKQAFFSDEVSSVMASERDLMVVANESETWDSKEASKEGGGITAGHLVAKYCGTDQAVCIST